MSRPVIASGSGDNLDRSRAGTTICGLSDQPSATSALGQTAVGTGILAWEAELNLGAQGLRGGAPGAGNSRRREGGEAGSPHSRQGCTDAGMRARLRGLLRGPGNEKGLVSHRGCLRKSKAPAHPAGTRQPQGHYRPNTELPQPSSSAPRYVPQRTGSRGSNPICTQRLSSTGHRGSKGKQHKCPSAAERTNEMCCAL